MIDLSKVNELLKATQNLAQLQQQVNVQSQTAPAAAQAPTASPQTNALFAQLGAVIANANAQTPATQNQSRVELLKQAAILSAKTKALIAKADALEALLNLSPTPDYVGVEELFAQFKEIIADLEKEMAALQKKVQEQEEQNQLKLEQKPTTMKPGEEVGDLSFNTTFSLQ